MYHAFGICTSTSMLCTDNLEKKQMYTLIFMGTKALRLYIVGLAGSRMDVKLLRPGAKSIQDYNASIGNAITERLTISETATGQLSRIPFWRYLPIRRIFPKHSENTIVSISQKNVNFATSKVKNTCKFNHWTFIPGCIYPGTPSFYVPTPNFAGRSSLHSVPGSGPGTES